MVNNKAPSEGTKVTLGENAPTYQEGTGKVPSGSLAAESAQHGGTFSENRGVDSSTGSENTSSQNTKSTSTGSSGPTSTANNGHLSNEAQGGPAPTYVSSQYATAGNGPHGKNLTEGIDYKGTEDGIAKAMKAELGSKDDPARAAEQQFIAGQARAAGGDGPKQFQTGGKTSFDALGEKAA